MSQQKSTRGGIPQSNDSQRLINRSNSEKIYKRFDELKNEGMPQQNNAKGAMSQYDDSQRSRNRSSSEKICKRSHELKDGGTPQCKIVTNIRHKMSPYKTLQDILIDDAMKKSNINE